MGDARWRAAFGDRPPAIIHSYLGAARLRRARSSTSGLAISFSGLVFRARRGGLGRGRGARPGGPRPGRDRLAVPRAARRPRSRNEPSGSASRPAWVAERRGVALEALGDDLVAAYDRTVPGRGRMTDPRLQRAAPSSPRPPSSSSSCSSLSGSSALAAAASPAQSASHPRRPRRPCRRRPARARRPRRRRARAPEPDRRPRLRRRRPARRRRRPPAPSSPRPAGLPTDRVVSVEVSTSADADFVTFVFDTGRSRRPARRRANCSRPNRRSLRVERSPARARRPARAPDPDEQHVALQRRRRADATRASATSWSAVSGASSRSSCTTSRRASPAGTSGTTAGLRRPRS